MDVKISESEFMMAEQLRLDKFLADMGIGTRTEIKVGIRKGRAMINGEICKKPEVKIALEKDQVSYDGKFIIYQKYLYFMLNKPAGVVSATVDNVSKTVIELIQDTMGKELFPVGRLDKDTEGMLIITNDGELAHQLLSPKKHVDKVYYAKIDGRVTEADSTAFLQGVMIGDDYTTLPAKLVIIKSGDISEIELTIQEGKFHQVKRMFEAVGKQVIYLKRLSMGGLALDKALLPGQYRSLNKDEVDYLYSLGID